MLTTSLALSYICFLIYKIHPFVYHACARHVLVPQALWAIREARSLLLRGFHSSEKRQTNNPRDKVVSTVINAIERLNLGEELERAGAGRERAVDNLTKKLASCADWRECSRPTERQGQRPGGT